jgi:hypothetical protein
VKTPAAQELLLAGRMEPGRLARRRFLFFTAIFALTSVAVWFLTDLLWRRAFRDRAGDPRDLRRAVRAHRDRVRDGGGRLLRGEPRG